MTLESNKNMGGIGAILMVLGVLPFLGAYSGIIAFIGLILVLIALKGMANHYNEAGIFDNALYGIISTIIGVAVFIAVVIGAAAGLLTALGIHISNWSDWSALQNFNWQGITDMSVIWPYVTEILLALVALFAFVVIATVFLRRSMNILSAKTGVHLFATTGILLLVGAILTIIVIGVLLIWIALILLAISFFRIRISPTLSVEPPRPA